MSIPSGETVAANAYIVVLYQDGQDGTISYDLAAQLRSLLERKVLTEPATNLIDVWLESPGGTADAAYKIGVLLRGYAATVRVVIPDFAKSAATLLSLVADEIFMAPAAELGPLDAQIPFEQEGMTISALDRVHSLTDLSNIAMNLVMSGGAAVMRYTRLSRAEALTAMLDFTAKFMSPIVAKLDPTMIHWSSTLLDVAKEYGDRLLAMRSPDAPVVPPGIPAKLLQEYPTHGFVIDISEAKKLGLPVRPLSQYTYSDQARALYNQHQAGIGNIIDVVSVSELVGESDEEATVDEAEGTDGTGREEHVGEPPDQAPGESHPDRGHEDRGAEGVV